jgi:F-type H+-transporting ATPase subunit epsilon
MNVEIITPEKTLFVGEAELIKLPGTVGFFEIMNHHAPLISTLAEGKIKVKLPGGTNLFFEITSGVVEVAYNEVKILVET